LSTFEAFPAAADAPMAIMSGINYFRVIVMAVWAMHDHHSVKIRTNVAAIFGGLENKIPYIWGIFSNILT
jgi:hypothetical protein